MTAYLNVLLTLDADSVSNGLVLSSSIKYLPDGILASKMIDYRGRNIHLLN